VEYRRRVVDNELDELMPGVAAIAIEGARAVGKTETASARATTEFRLDVPAVYEALRADPTRIATSPRPDLIDKWQLMKETWMSFARRSMQTQSASSFSSRARLRPGTRRHTRAPAGSSRCGCGR
jgi:hypothetical protein